MQKMYLLLLLLFSSNCFAFPSNIRLGYPTCAACHINPTGGGVLTPYGRSTLSEAMTSWAYDGEEGVLYGLFRTSKRLDVAADARWLQLPDQGFFMQREAEVSLNIKRQYYLVASGGIYGPLDEQDSRRYYVMFTDQKSIWFKAGRFFPAFGIMSNEHYLLYRKRNFNQGRETWNAEVIYRGQWFEAAGSKIFGHPEDFEQGTKTSGFSGRFLLIPPRWRTSAGVSVLGLVDELGVFQTQTAVSLLYGPMKELELEMQAGELDMYARISVEPYKGFSLKPTMQWVYTDKQKYSLAIEWLPRPHFDAQMIFEEERYIFQYHFFI